jgi:hypothetical protein
VVLPEGFQFSQANLQDFVTCARRFQLRYLMALQWPAAETEPIEAQERRVMLGQAFHRLVQQWTLGLPEERLARHATDPELQRWWQALLTYRPIATFGADDKGAVVRTEYGLVGRVGGYRLVAHYDALITHPSGRATILDWKTSTKRPQDQQLRERLQSRVYPYLLVQAGHALTGGAPISPEQVEMVYWFPEFPHAPARLPYSPSAYETDSVTLTDLVERISRMGEDDYLLTDDERACRFCAFRSYCGRGERAGAVEEAPAEWELQEIAGEDFDLDFDQISEIAF